MSTVAFPIPDEVLPGMGVSPDDATTLARRMAALELYERRSVSLGWCAEIAGMRVEDFMRFLGEHGASVFRYDSEEEFLAEAAHA